MIETALVESEYDVLTKLLSRDFQDG